jgi:transposase
VLLVQETLNIRISLQLARAVLASSGLTRKKAKFFGDPKDLPEKTAAFLRRRQELLDDGREFWSLDETSFGRHGAPVMGYAPKGHPLMLRRKQQFIQTTSVISIVHASGILYRQSKVGSFNSESFTAFLDSLDIPDGSVILLDNASIHKCQGARILAERRGWELLFVPPYSPWFNPIKGVFSVVKRAWYSGVASIDDAFTRATPSHIGQFFKHSLAHKGLL